MKHIIKENERGFLFKNGLFVKMLEPGVFHTYPLLQQTIISVNAEGEVKIKDINIKTLKRDEAFMKASVTVDVPDNHIALRFKDGRLDGCLDSGEYCFWNVFSKYTFRIIDISQPEALDIPAEYFNFIPIRYYTRVDVLEGTVALLYYDGAFKTLLESGTHFFWNYRTKVTFQKVDLRIQQMDVPGQEILTKDKVSLRLNFVCSYKIVDPVRIMGELLGSFDQVYSTVQLVLRKYVGRYRFDELLEQKEEIADFVLEKLREQQSRFYIEFADAGIKDIILPGEIREIMNSVLTAEKTAQANIIARREEVASTRSLLNTAKLLDENETLRRLKEMEYLERICDRVGHISLAGNGNLLGQLQDLIAAR